MKERVPMAAKFQTFILLFWGLWRAAGCMLLGMALFKIGVLTGHKSPGFYRRMATICGVVGVPIVIYGIHRNFEAGWSVEYSQFFGGAYNYVGSVFVALMWVALVMLMCRTGVASFVRGRLASAGRMAFTNYLMQTVICTFIFYGHGLGYFGSVSRVGQVLIVFGVWTLQLLWSKPWLEKFRFGPAEWLWRSLCYGRTQPMKR